MQFELATLFGPLALGILLSLVLMVYVGLSIAFVYHWREYGMNTGLIKLAPPLYFSVSGALIAMTALSYLILI